MSIGVFLGGDNASESTALKLAESYIEEKYGDQYDFRYETITAQDLWMTKYDVYTLDDKHKEVDCLAERHCYTDFSVPRQYMRAIVETWGGGNLLGFDIICLDYFFSPSGWTEIRWNESFISKTIPDLLLNGWLNENGKIWLPNKPSIRELVDKHIDKLSEMFIIQDIADPNENPLCKASDSCHQQLLECGNVTNESQLKVLPLDYPFLCLTAKC